MNIDPDHDFADIIDCPLIVELQFSFFELQLIFYFEF